MMSVSDAIRGRYSVRGFTPEPVPEPTIREIFDIARLAPSNSNTQPWHVAVVSGSARDELEKKLLATIEAGSKPNPTWPSGGVGLKGDYKQRQRDCAFGYEEQGATINQVRMPRGTLEQVVSFTS